MLDESKTKEIADRLAKTMPCNCDLDNWEPERSTGHSRVCRIHKAARAEALIEPAKRHSELSLLLPIKLPFHLNLRRRKMFSFFKQKQVEVTDEQEIIFISRDATVKAAKRLVAKVQEEADYMQSFAMWAAESLPKVLEEAEGGVAYISSHENNTRWLHHEPTREKVQKLLLEHGFRSRWFVGEDLGSADRMWVYVRGK